MADRSRRSDFRADAKYLLAHLDQFLSVVEVRRPGVIFFFGSCLGVALERALKNSKQDSKQDIETVFGELERTPLVVTRDEAGEPRFFVRDFQFSRCRVLAFPHPTGAKGVTNAQIARYAPEVRDAIGLWSSLRANHQSEIFL